MIGMLVSAIDEQTEKDRQFLESLHYEERLYNVKDVVSFRTETQKILTELIAYKQTSQDVVVPRLVQDVERYLAGHYMENDVSVSSVAAQFHISESYLSRLFKTYLKCNGLEYIQRLRIEKAKELLKAASIKDTARQVGFWDTQALIRVFKKYEGITPGKYLSLIHIFPWRPQRGIGIIFMKISVSWRPKTVFSFIKPRAKLLSRCFLR